MEHLQRNLRARHIRFLALGSAIGTGLFYGSASAIQLAAPAVILGASNAGGSAFGIVMTGRSIGVFLGPILLPPVLIFMGAWQGIGPVFGGISLAAAGVFVQSFFGGSAEGEGADAPAEEPFISWESFTDILRVGIPGLIMILLTSTISIYFASAAFVFYCLFYVGRHGLKTSLSVAVGVPIGVFFIFEKFLIIPLPKGFAEPLFYLEWGSFL